MRRCLRLATLSATLSFALAAMGQPTAQQPSEAKRLRVGLVLSGGGARGGAHIGVLKVLEEMRVPVDVIVGTSAGSIVGSAYASGLPLADIESEMKNLSTATLFRDISREDAPYRRKSDDAVNYIGPEMGITRNGLALPKGAVAGVSLEAVLRRLTRRQTTTNFDRLPIPFRAIATDLTNAQMVAISNGQLALAARASMAVPGAVNPVEIDGRLLVDGGLKRNLPIDVARGMGADVVIAVNIGTPLLKRDQISSLLTVTDQVLRILTDSNVAQSLKELTPRDVLITPDLQDIKSADFDRLSEAAHQGELAARAAADHLAQYALSETDYSALLRSRALAQGDTAVPIAEVRVVGTHVVNPDVVLAAMETRAGAPLDPDLIDRDIKRIYSRGDFESVNYTLTDEGEGGRVLVADVTEKSWGPNYLRLGLSLSSDFEGNSFFSLTASQRRTWLNELGAEWRNDIQLGQTNRLTSEWYQPLTPKQRVFIAPRVEAADEPFDVYDPNTNKRLVRFRRQAHEFGIDVGAPLGTAGEGRLGLVRGRVHLSDDTSLVSASLLNLSRSTGGALVRLRLDRLDSLNFPRSGYAGDLRLFFSQPRLGADDDYTKGSLSLQAATHRGPHTVRAAFRAGGNLKDGELPAHEVFKLGGFLQLSGYKTDQLLGTDMRFGRLVYNYRLSGPGFLDGMYVGGSLEAGRIGEFADADARPKRRLGSSLYFALDTPLGPLYLAFGVADGGNKAGYLFLGQP